MGKNPRVEVFARFSVEGFHWWPNAPKEVEFLRARHRHLFGFKVSVVVSHDDRDVEFIILGRRAKEYILANPINGRESCEAIARRLAAHLASTYGWQVCSVEVDEDGENGAVLTWEV